MTRMSLRTLLATALATVLVHAQGPPPSMPDGTNVLVGRVVEVGTGAPVGGAIVTLTGQFNLSATSAVPTLTTRGVDAPPAVNVMSTASGQFAFRRLPAGLFSVATRAFGYVNSDYPPMVIEIQNSQRPAEVELHVWKYAAIGGRVLDERGDPVAGIPVDALHRVASGNGWLLRRARTALTDDRGEYRIAQLTPGDYVAAVLSTTTTLPQDVAALLDPSPANRSTFSAVSLELLQGGLARTYGCPTCFGSGHEGQHVDGFVLQRPGPPLPPAPDGRPLGFASTYYPGTSSPDASNAVTLESGGSRADLDLVLRLAPTVSVSGVLTGPDGPMAHVVLTLATHGTDLYDLDPPGVATAITDARGVFRFLAVVPGDYTLSSALPMLTSEATGEGRPLWVTQPLSVGDTGVAGLTLAMQPGVRMSGHVEFKSAAGLVNRPSQRHVLNLQPLNALTWRTIPAVVQADGTFRSAGDPPGRYILNASSPPGWFWQATTLAGRPVLDETVDLTSSELSGIILTFRETTNRVSGRVTDGSGAPDPNAAVIVFPADSNAWHEGVFTSRRERKVRASSAGSYDVTTLAPGDYYVAAVDADAALNWQEPRFLERLVAGATKVTLGAEDQRSVPLHAIVPSGRAQ
jgi:protocatechuate 3,4-dioxygenase beta subunit